MLAFREIDVDRDGETCIRFRVDSFTESFGSPDAFFREAGPDASAYLSGLRTKMQAWPGSCVHAWRVGEIVGQIEVRLDRVNDSNAARADCTTCAPMPEDAGSVMSSTHTSRCCFATLV